VIGRDISLHKLQLVLRGLDVQPEDMADTMFGDMADGLRRRQVDRGDLGSAEEKKMPYRPSVESGRTATRAYVGSP
jgi:hypothetical protein